MAEKIRAKRRKLRREYHKFETRDAALEFLSKHLVAVDPHRTAVSLSEGSLTVTLEDDHETKYTLTGDGLRVTIERRIEPSRRSRHGAGTR